MPSEPLAVLGVGLTTAVGLSAPAACAAIRAKLTNPTETRFIDSAGNWIMGHEVPLAQPWRGPGKLARMAAMAIEECLQQVPRAEWAQIPVLLCVAEPDRPGRMQGLDGKVFRDIEQLLGGRLAAASGTIAQGRTAVATALEYARELILQGTPRVLVAATDSLLNWRTLQHYLNGDRLLTKRNSDGFIPGEGAGAVLVGRPTGRTELLCTGLGFGVETAHIDSSEPLRADGLTGAIKAALVDSGRQMQDMDFRIADLSGEQYYFKEAALAVTRTLRHRKAAFDLWHPAECTGEAGALAGAAIIAVADAACRKGYSKGLEVLAHMASDAGGRAAMTLRFESA